MCRARNQTAFKGSSWVFLSLLIFFFFFLLVLTLYLLFFSISSRLGFMLSLSLSLSLSPSLSFSLTPFCSSAPLPATLCLLIATRYPSHATSNSFCYTLSHTSPKLTLRALLFLSPLLSPPSVRPSIGHAAPWSAGCLRGVCAVTVRLVMLPQAVFASPTLRLCKYLSTDTHTHTNNHM